MSISALPLLIQGVQRSADSYTFLVCAQRMIEQETLVQALLENFLQPWCRLYSTYLILLSTAVKHYGDGWSQVIAVSNILFHASAITCMAYFSYFVTKKLSLTMLISLLLMFSVDILIRVHWPISDSLFLLTATLSFVMVSLTFYMPKNVLLMLVAIFSLFITGLTRPHGLGIFIVGILAVIWRKKFSKLTAKAGFVSIILVLVGLIISFLVVALRFGPDYVATTTEDSILQEYQSTGQVIEGVYSTYNAELGYFIVRFYTIVERFITFFSYFPPHWSVRHIFLSSLFFLPWNFGIISCWALFGSRVVDPRIRSLILLSTVWIIAIAAFAGWFTITYEHRYRLSLMPIFAFQTVLGIFLLFNKLKGKKN
jgi:hypothetical protein